MIVPWPGPHAAPPAAVAVGDDMHYRFEIRLLARFIVGRRPEIRILRIAWDDKREHLQCWLESYYRQHRVLPRGCHDLGVTPRHRLAFGVVDFDAARTRLARERAFRHLCQRLPGWLGGLLDTAFPVIDAALRVRGYRRGCPDPCAGRLF